jgi:hypothetical protein
VVTWISRVAAATLALSALTGTVVGVVSAVSSGPVAQAEGPKHEVEPA